MTTIEDIETLRKQLHIGEAKVRELEQKLEDCEREHADEKKKLEQELEKEKEEKRKVQEYNEYYQNFGYRDEIIDRLRARIKKLEEEVQRLKEQLETSRKERTDTQRKLLEVESKNTALERKVKYTQAKLEEIESKNTALQQKVEALQDDQNILYLGEMCKRLQWNIYRYVFPEKIKISPIVSHKIKDIGSIIRNKKQLSEQEKREATTRWEKLKTQLKPEEFYTLIDKLQNSRNTLAHPKITKDVAFKAAEELNKEGVFEFMASLEDVNKLIKLWEATEKL